MADQLFLATLRTDRPAFEFRSRLDGIFYGFRLVFVQRSKRWFFDILQDDGTPINEGMAMSTGTDLLGPFGSGKFPPGQLFILDTTGADRDATLHDLRGDHRLIYRPVDDVPLHDGEETEVF